MKIIAVTQARIGSTRLPGKIMKQINGVTLLELHLERIRRSKLVDKIIVATTTEQDVIKIIKICDKLDIVTYKGSLNNVLERFYMAVFPESPDWIVRLTSDCPLIDPVEIDKVINHAVSKNFDYVSNTLRPTFPDGMDVEVFKFKTLEKAFNEAKLKSDLEHVTPYIWKNSSFMGGSMFSSDCVVNDIDYSKFRLTVDTLEDFLVIEKLLKNLGKEKSWKEYIDYMVAHPEITQLNAIFQRNEGYQKSINND